jgi:hypothetical protein
MQDQAGGSKQTKATAIGNDRKRTAGQRRGGVDGTCVEVYSIQQVIGCPDSGIYIHDKITGPVSGLVGGMDLHAITVADQAVVDRIIIHRDGAEKRMGVITQDQFQYLDSGLAKQKVGERGPGGHRSRWRRLYGRRFRGADGFPDR